MNSAEVKNKLIYLEWLALLPLFATAFFAFSKAQHEAILERDEHKCQAPWKHECKGRLEVHHVLPQGYSKMFGVDPDFVENGITLCQNSHVGREGVHPDTAEAFDEYKTNKRAFKDMIARRAEKLKEHIIYWNSEHDRPMQVVALKRTQEAKKRGQIFP